MAESGSRALRVALLMPSLGPGGAEHVASILAPLLCEVFDFDLLLLEDRRAYPLAVGDRVHAFSGPLNGALAHLVRIPYHLHALKRWIRLHRPDVVLSFLEQANILNLLAARSCGHAAVISQKSLPDHQYAPKGLLGKAIMAASRRLYPEARRVLAVSQGVRQSLIDLYDLDPDCIRVIENPQDVARLERQMRVRPSDALAEPFLFHAGRLNVATKGQNVLLQSFALIRKERPDLWLVIAGDGPDREMLERMSRELGIAEHVRWLGWREEIAWWMAEAEAFLLASRYEGWCNALMEALGVGTAAVATDCPTGPREILRDGECGVLVPPDDPEALARATLDLLADDDRRERLRAAGRQRAAQFHPLTIAGRYADALREAVGSTQGAG